MDSPYTSITISIHLPYKIFELAFHYYYRYCFVILLIGLSVSKGQEAFTDSATATSSQAAIGTYNNDAISLCGSHEEIYLMQMLLQP